MKARRTFRRRLWALALVAFLAASSAILWSIGVSRLRDVNRQCSELHDASRQILRYVARLHRQVALLEGGAEDSVSYLHGLLEESDEALAEVRDDFGAMLGDRSNALQMFAEWEELLRAREPAASGTAVRETSEGVTWSRYATDLQAFGEHFDDVSGQLSVMLGLQRQAAETIAGGARVCGLLAFLVTVWVLLTVFSDIASDSYEPALVEEELARVGQDRQFRSRLGLLLPDDVGEVADCRLTLVDRAREQRTHVCFEVDAACQDHKVRLWGRRYKWAGYIKSFQRVFLPAFAEATWRALCLMHNNGLGSPVPIVYKQLRTGPFKAGAIILMEHVGEVDSVKEFLEGGFCLLDGEGQERFLKQLVAFLRSVHELGIYGIKPRYVHGKRLKQPEETHFYLFDLDKVTIWENCPGFIRRRLRAKDRRRLLRRLEPVLSRGSLERVRNWLRNEVDPA